MKYILMILIVLVAIKLFRKPKEVTAQEEQKAVDTIQDPITGTFVSKDSEYKVKYFDKIYYFSTRDSMEKFIAEKKEQQ